MIEQENFFFNIDYGFFSILDEKEPEDRYVTTIFGNVYKEDYDSQIKESVGSFTLKLLHIGNALNDGIDAFTVFDTEQTILNIGEEIYDFDNEELLEGIQSFYDYSFYHTDICICDRLEIYPKYRGEGIGKKVHKDIYNNFNNSCGLFVVKVFPLQFEVGAEKNEKYSKMGLDKLERNKKKAFNKLKTFYEKCGFDYIPSISKELMFINPAVLNPGIDAIRF